MPHGHVRCLPAPPHGGKCACYEGRGTINGWRQSDAKANRNVVASSLETKTIVPSKVLCAESWCPAEHRLVLDASTLRFKLDLSAILIFRFCASSKSSPLCLTWLHYLVSRHALALRRRLRSSFFGSKPDGIASRMQLEAWGRRQTMLKEAATQANRTRSPTAWPCEMLYALSVPSASARHLLGARTA